ncbi:MAG: hypothetical protein MO852_11650 [Candidatus Devosia euplotis]|nr:hypothetical protein [Candidatus Devosia euplotis]
MRLPSGCPGVTRAWPQSWSFPVKSICMVVPILLEDIILMIEVQETHPTVVLLDNLTKVHLTEAVPNHQAISKITKECQFTNKMEETKDILLNQTQEWANHKIPDKTTAATMKHQCR